MARTRRSAEATRALMVEAGVAMLQRSGIDVGVDGLTLEAICIEQDIARSSSHAAWAIDDHFSPQETFQRAVLELWLAKSEGTVFATTANDTIAKVLSEQPDATSFAIQEGIEAAFLEGAARYEAGEGDFISTDMAMRFALASQQADERDEELFEWIKQSEQRNRDNRTRDIYKPMGELIGLVPKPGLGEDAYDFFGMAVAALLEGFTLRRYLVPQLDCLTPIGPAEDGDYDESVLAASIQAMVPVFFEPAKQAGNDSTND